MYEKDGFTLVELLVVIAIIGLLASIAVVALNGARLDARNAKRLADIDQIANALELYFNKYGDYPNNDSSGYNQRDVQFFNNGSGESWFFDSNCDSSGNKDEFLTPLVDEGFISSEIYYPNASSYVYCYQYSSTRDLDHMEGVYYLMAGLEPYTGSNIAPKSCPGLDDDGPADGWDWWTWLSWMYCVGEPLVE